jgi:hypothetical protein
MVDKQEAIRHAEARASAAEQLVVAVAHLAAVVADIGDRSFVGCELHSYAERPK